MRKILPLSVFVLGVAFAHKVSLFVSTQNGYADVYGYFSDGTPAKGSTVEVYDAKSEKLLLKGKTDRNGFYEFKIPKGVSKLKIVLYAGLGHKAVQTLSVGSAEQQPQATKGEENAKGRVENKTSNVNEILKIPQNVEKVQIIFYTASGKEVLTFMVGSLNVQKAVSVEGENKKGIPNSEPPSEKEVLQKIRKEVQRETAFPWFKVFCGIGWILGIFGILNLVHGRRSGKA